MAVNDKLNYVDGVTPSIAKRIATFAFGGSMFKFEKDKTNREFKVYLFKGEVSQGTIDYFKKHWHGFKIFLISRQESEQED